MQAVLAVCCTRLLLAGELLVGDVGGQVGVEHGTEGQPIVPAAAEVGDVDVLEEETTEQTEQTEINFAPYL